MIASTKVLPEVSYSIVVGPTFSMYVAMYESTEIYFRTSEVWQSDSATAIARFRAPFRRERAWKIFLSQKYILRTMRMGSSHEYN